MSGVSFNCPCKIESWNCWKRSWLLNNDSNKVVRYQPLEWSMWSAKMILHAQIRPLGSEHDIIYSWYIMLSKLMRKQWRGWARSWSWRRWRLWPHLSAQRRHSQHGRPRDTGRQPEQSRYLDVLFHAETYRAAGPDMQDQVDVDDFLRVRTSLLFEPASQAGVTVAATTTTTMMMLMKVVLMLMVVMKMMLMVMFSPSMFAVLTDPELSVTLAVSDGTVGRVRIWAGTL